MRQILAAVALIALLFAWKSPGSAQAPASPGAAPVTLPHLVLSADSLDGLPRRSVTVSGEDGRSATYSGVDLGVLLAKHGAPSASTLRGSALADYVLVRATDGYRALFALPELDATFTDKIVLLADRRNGEPLPAAAGPFQVVVPDEKHHARWIHSVTEIDVLASP
jgi:hypothetical protein